MPNDNSQLPILGIEYTENRDVMQDKVTVKRFGPCTRDDCGKLAWLSHKNGEYTCPQCWYGPQHQTDPVVNDILHHLRYTFDQFAGLLEDGHTVTEAVGKAEATIEEVICPHCLDEQDPDLIDRGPFDVWACEGCIQDEVSTNA